MGDTLNVLRHSKFVQMLTTSSLVEPSDLPSTERAVYFHALRMQIQVAQWMNLDLQCLDPIKWYWKLKNNYLAPKKTDINPEPKFLLNFIRFKCKKTAKNLCGITHCSCRKNFLKHVATSGDYWSICLIIFYQYLYWCSIMSIIISIMLCNKYLDIVSNLLIECYTVFSWPFFDSISVSSVNTFKSIVIIFKVFMFSHSVAYP